MKKSPNFFWTLLSSVKKSWEICSHFCGHLSIYELYRKNVKINYFLSTEYSAMVVDSAMTRYVISPPKTKGCLAGLAKAGPFWREEDKWEKMSFFFFMTSHSLSNSAAGQRSRDDAIKLLIMLQCQLCLA